MDDMTTIQDLPCEILQTLAFYLNLRSLNDLMSVYDDFKNTCISSNRLWKRHLLYPEKYYKGDFNDNSRVQTIEDIVSEISKNKEISKNYGYFKLQTCHLDNFRLGRIVDLHTIRAIDLGVESLRYISHMSELVDDLGQHWLFLCLDSSIHVWNLTSRPQQHERLHLSKFCGIKLFNEGILVDCSPEGNSGLRAVYKFEPPSYNLQLHYKFVYYMDSALPVNSIPPQEIRFGFHEILMNNLFIVHDIKFDPQNECLLHVWDLTSGVKFDKINLAEHAEVCERFFKCIENTIKVEGPCFPLLSIYPGMFPSLIVVLQFGFQYISQVNIFNVTTKQFTHFVDHMYCNVINCSMYSNKLSVETLEDGKSNVYLYSLHSGNKEDELGHGQKMVSVGYSHKSIIIFKESKVLVRVHASEVHIFNVKENLQNWKIQFSIRHNFEILGFMEPSFVLAYDFHQDPTNTSLTVIDVSNSREVITWANVNINSSRYHTYFKNLKYPSKLILNINHELRVMKF